VVHYDVPGSVEAYYQEAGRDGRDGNPARCVLLFHHRDVSTQEFFIQQSADAHQDELRALLGQMVSYAHSSPCRQLTLLNYFGDTEEAAFGPCGHCDRCMAPAASPETDAGSLIAVRVALGAVAALHGRFGLARVTEILAGSRSQALERAGLHRVDSFGTLRHWTRPAIGRLLRRLIASGHLHIDGLEYPVIELTARGAAVLGGTVTLVWEQDPASASTSTGRWSGTGVTASVPEDVSKSRPLSQAEEREGQGMRLDQELFDRLRRLRTAIAAEEGVAAFLVFHDKILRLITARRPASIEALGEIPGIGAVKMDRYGRRVLEVVNQDQHK
jgi:ATP-dependent DNA helicase RecQ